MISISQAQESNLFHCAMSAKPVSASHLICLFNKTGACKCHVLFLFLTLPPFFFFLLCFHPCSKLVSKRRKAHLRRLDRRWTLGGIVNRQQSRGEWIASYGNSPKGTPNTMLLPPLLCTWVLPGVFLPLYTARERLKLQSSDVYVIYDRLRVSWSHA